MDPNQGLTKCVVNNIYWWCVSIASIVLMINNPHKIEWFVDRQKHNLTMDYLDLQMTEHLIIPK